MFAQTMKLIFMKGILVGFLMVLAIMPSPVFSQTMLSEDAMLEESEGLISALELEAEGEISPLQASELGSEASGLQAQSEGTSLEGMMALMIPHVVIAAGLIFGLGLIWLMLKWRELSHKERLAAIERGLPHPDLGSRQQFLLWGMILFALGLATIVALWVNFGWSHALWGLLPLLSGLALFLYVTLIEEKTVSVPGTSIPASS